MGVWLYRKSLSDSRDHIPVGLLSLLQLDPLMSCSCPVCVCCEMCLCRSGFDSHILLKYDSISELITY